MYPQHRQNKCFLCSRGPVDVWELSESDFWAANVRLTGDDDVTSDAGGTEEIDRVACFTERYLGWSPGLGETYSMLVNGSIIEKECPREQKRRNHHRSTLTI